MCFGGKNERSDDPPPRPAQNYQNQTSSNDSKMSNLASNNPYNNNCPGQSQSGNTGGSSSNYHAPAQQQYAPPSGPPPSHNQQPQEDFAPPAGPPPTYRPQPQQQQDEYAPPPGPPPPKSHDNTSGIAPPPGGPSQQPQHNWETAVPDTSLFPPPPALFSGYDNSPAHNATEDEAKAGTAWCNEYPITGAMSLDAAGAEALRSHNFRLVEPAGFNGGLNWQGPGVWAVSTRRNAPDRSFFSYPPLYVVAQHAPMSTGRPKTVYYEVKIRPSSPNINVALGFAAMPYPSFRLPGWHRASLAVHGDDGHKYINDLYGGKDFTSPFRKGETYGLGMKMVPLSNAAQSLDVQVFFTRNGVVAGSWNLHEETDAGEDLPVTGLEGFHDLCASIGAFDATEFEVVFDPSKWMYQGIEKEY